MRATIAKKRGTERLANARLCAKIGSEMMMLTVERLRTPILGTGLVKESEFEEYMTFYHDPDCTFRFLISGAWGRKPASVCL